MRWPGDDALCAHHAKVMLWLQKTVCTTYISWGGEEGVSQRWLVCMQVLLHSPWVMVNEGSKNIVKGDAGKAVTSMAETGGWCPKQDLICCYPCTCFSCIDKVLWFPDIWNILCNCFAIPLSLPKKISSAGYTPLTGKGVTAQAKSDCWGSRVSKG